jgi:hypothetical protein
MIMTSRTDDDDDDDDEAEFINGLFSESQVVGIPSNPWWEISHDDDDDTTSSACPFPTKISSNLWEEITSEDRGSSSFHSLASSRQENGFSIDVRPPLQTTPPQEHDAAIYLQSSFMSDRVETFASMNDKAQPPYQGLLLARQSSTTTGHKTIRPPPGFQTRAVHSSSSRHRHGLVPDPGASPTSTMGDTLDMQRMSHHGHPLWDAHATTTSPCERLHTDLPNDPIDDGRGDDASFRPWMSSVARDGHGRSQKEDDRTRGLDDGIPARTRDEPPGERDPDIGPHECDSGEDGSEDEGDDDDDRDEENEDDGDENSEPSIPLDIQYSAFCSDTSSLSDFDNYSDISSSSHIIGYDTDQAHVSHIAGVLDGSIVAAGGDGKSTSTTPTAVYSEEKLPKTEEPRNGEKNFKMKSMWQTLMAFVVLRLQNMKNSTTALARSRHSQAISETMRSTIHWLAGVRDAGMAFVHKFLKYSKKCFCVSTNLLILLASFFFQVWKLSMIEMVKEPNVTLCYLTFYSMPQFCSLLMNWNLPHWTPQLVTLLGVFCLCNPVEPGMMLDEDATATPRSSTPNLTSGATITNTSASRSSDWCATRQRALSGSERACHIMLRILRYTLPLLFVADGFSSEYGTLMSENGSYRLTTAFMMCLIRNGRVASPIGWISWALQVLITNYGCCNGKVMDLTVLIVGLTSLRIQDITSSSQREKRKEKRG